MGFYISFTQNVISVQINGNLRIKFITAKTVVIILTEFFLFCRYTKLGYAGNTEPQFIIPSCKYFF